MVDLAYQATFNIAEKFPIMRKLKHVLGSIPAYFYRKWLRPLMPVDRPIEYSHIPVSIDKRLGDSLVPKSFLPFMNYDIDTYEAALISGLGSNVREGDNVVIIGGGEGVTAVVAANCVGARGHVTCFEGSARQIERMKVTFSRNKVESLIEIRYAIVGEAINVYGCRKQDALVMPPVDLPVCDILELDCEGAEFKILDQMTISPRVILVETHGVHGSPTDTVRKILEGRGYKVSDLGWAEPDRLDDCVFGDIRVLEARRI